MKNRVWRAFVASLIIAVAEIAPSPVQAGLNHQLDIPPQELGSALAMLARQANIQLVYSAKLVEGKISSPINGSMTTETALQRLLGPFGLRYQFLDTTTITISPASQSDGDIESAKPVSTGSRVDAKEPKRLCAAEAGISNTDATEI